MDLKDFRGTVIQVGSTIVYAVRGTGGNTYVNEAIVEKIEETRRSFSLSSTPVLKVRGTGRGTKKWRVHKKQVTLTALENVVVVQP